MSPDDPRHGTYAGAVAHWKTKTPMCEPCGEAAYKNRKQRRVKHKDAMLLPITGTRRRIQALRALGYSHRSIADRVGVRDSVLSNWLYRADWIARRNRDRVARVYDELCMTPPAKPDPRTIRAAYRNGWVPPLAWDDIDHDDAPASADTTGADLDEMAVYRRLNGDHRVALNRLERREAVRLAHARNLSDGDIGRLLGYADRTILRIRQELNLPAYDPERQSA